jgi:hypothetical protein
MSGKGEGGRGHLGAHDIEAAKKKRETDSNCDATAGSRL